MICFCYFFQKTLFFILGVIYNDPFCANCGQKSNFQRVYPFFRATGLQHKLLILLESPNIFHQKSTKKLKQVWSFGQALGQIRPNVVKKKRNRHFNGVFFIFCMRNTFKSKKQQVQNYLRGNSRLNQLKIPYLKEIRTKFLPILGQKQQKVVI